MASFEWVALDGAGRTRTGVLSAADERAAREVLARKALAPVSLAPASADAPAAGRKPRLSRRELAVFTRQLATLVSVAPLEESLRALAAQAPRPAARAVLKAVHAAVVEGFRLSDAFGRQERSFPAPYRAMIAAGESSGALPTILERLADLLDREQQTRSKVTSALVYPAVLSVVAVLVVAALMAFVVPRVVEQFDGMNQTLPFLTRAVIFASDALRIGGLPALALLALAGFGFVRALKRPAFRRRVDATLLALPTVGRLIRDLEGGRFARTTATMIASGVPVLEALILSGRTLTNTVLRDAVHGAAVAVREGSGLAAALRRADAFPPVLVTMASSGENAGRLDVLLARAADYLEREFQDFTAAVLSLLEPAVIVVMGAIVALIVLSILLPILQLNTLALQ